METSTDLTSTVAATQGTPAAVTAPWPVLLSDGTAALGTSGNPVRVDTTGSTTQPVSGTVTANLGTLNGAATAALQGAGLPVALGTAGGLKVSVVDAGSLATASNQTSAQSSLTTIAGGVQAAGQLATSSARTVVNPSGAALRVYNTPTGGAAWVSSAPQAITASVVIKASPGSIQWINITNLSPTVLIAYWLHDLTSAPAYSATASTVITSGLVGSGGSQGTRIPFPESGYDAAVGMVLIVSSATSAHTALATAHACVAWKSQ